MKKAVITPKISSNEYGEFMKERLPNLMTHNMIYLKGKNVWLEVRFINYWKKAKNLIAIEQSTNGYFNIEDIGYVYKLGKVKETR